MLPRGSGAIGLVRQHREGSLETVRKVARSGDGTFNRLFPIFEQRVQIVNERLNFAWICSLDSPILACTNSRQSFPQSPERRQALSYSQDSRGHEEQACESWSSGMGRADARKDMHDHQRKHVYQHEQSTCP